MKRVWKIAGITLGAVIGLVVIVAAIAVWIVFTPQRLTPIVRHAADRFISCEHRLGDVELTFFSTFPEFGLRTNEVLLLNPMEGAPSDTLLYAPEVVARVNVTAFIRNRHLQVRELLLDDIQASVYINVAGENNFSVFATEPDTVAEDTSALSLPFESIEVNRLSVSARHLSLLDERDTIVALLPGMHLKAQVGSWSDMNLSLDAPDATVAMKGTTYADHLYLGVKLPAGINLDAMTVDLHRAQVSVNDYTVVLDGHAQLQPQISMDMHVSLTDWALRPVIALVPERFTQALRDIDVDGVLSLDADIQGVYNDSTMPVIDASVVLQDGGGRYRPLPYTFTGVAADMQAHIDFNDTTASNVTVRALRARTRESRIALSGQIDQLLADMQMAVTMDVDVNLPDADYFLPKEMTVKGRAKGNINAHMRLSDLVSKRLSKGCINGQLHLTDVDYTQDSLWATLPKTDIRFTLPNPKPSHTTTSWLAADITLHQGLSFRQQGSLHADLAASELAVELGDMLSNNPVLYAAATLQSDEYISAVMDSMDVHLTAPELVAYAEYDTQDATQIPVLTADLSFDRLKGHYTDIAGVLQKAHLNASIRGGRRDKSAPTLKATVRTQSLEANVGQDIRLQTGDMTMTAAAHHNKEGKNILLQWNPLLHFQLKQGKVNMAALSQTIQVPQIAFDYSNRVCKIDTSQIVIGRSDFSLSGEVRQIDKWLQHRDTLRGVLNFTSHRTDANELMALFSADKGSEETAAASTATTPATATAEGDTVGNETEPFLVPTDVDLTLNTHIYETDIFNQTARNLGGRIYIRHGVLVLEEVGFVCRAAKLQLTAMYKTPKRNHLYLGFDYHMLDINIQELIHMIPAIDTMVPMLQSFKGSATFHLAAETYLKSDYTPKISTLRGACSIAGKDLVVLDNTTFSKIAKILSFKKKTENKVDSINAEITVYKDEIDVYPFCVSIDNYTAALGGRHNLDMTFDYHVNLLSPLYIGVDVKGNLDNLTIKPAACRYAKDFKPLFHGKVDTQSAELRQTIRQSMQQNVRIQSDQP